MASEKFCLRWNDFESNISIAFKELSEEKDFFDAALACGDSQVQAHKVIVSACSFPLLQKHPAKEPPSASTVLLVKQWRKIVKKLSFILCSVLYKNRWNITNILLQLFFTLKMWFIFFGVFGRKTGRAGPITLKLSTKEIGSSRKKLRKQKLDQVHLECRTQFGDL